MNMKEIAKRYQNLVRHAEAKKQLYNESMKNTELQMNELFLNVRAELDQHEQDIDYLLVTFNAEADTIAGDVSRDPRVLSLTRKLEKAVEAIREAQQYAGLHFKLTK